MTMLDAPLALVERAVSDYRGVAGESAGDCAGLSRTDVCMLHARGDCFERGQYLWLHAGRAAFRTRESAGLGDAERFDCRSGIGGIAQDALDIR